MKTIRYGMSGPMVEYLQLALSRAGYDTEIDGIFGRRTLASLERFQGDNRLTPDGIAGRLTWAKLFPYLTGYTLRVIQPGDTLYLLAERYGTSVEAILTANPDTEPERLTVGQELVIPLGFPVTAENVAYSSVLVGLILEGLSARYPFIGRESIGSSVMGKRLEAVSMGAGNSQVFYNAAHHANEWITTPLLLKFLETYAKAYAEDGRIYDVSARTLFSNTRLFMAPLVDPDGVDLVTGALSDTDSFYLQAKALASFYPSIPFPNGWKANIAGTDLNLGYPADWEQARRIKYAQGYTRPGPRDFVGTQPLSAPEDRAVYDYTLSHDFRLTLSYHTQGEVIYWKYQNYEPPRSREIAEAFSRASGYPALETPYNSGFAGYKDWFIEAYNRPGYTIEAGRGVSPLPWSQFAEIWQDNLGILTLGMLLSM